MASHLIDATRMSDGKMVYIKRIKAGNREASIALSLYTERLRSNPMNHTVPILDTFADPGSPGDSFMVMPFLREPDDPPLERVGEVVDYVDQVLEVMLVQRSSFRANNATGARLHARPRYRAP